MKLTFARWKYCVLFFVECDSKYVNSRQNETAFRYGYDSGGSVSICDTWMSSNVPKGNEARENNFDEFDAASSREKGMRDLVRLNQRAMARLREQQKQLDRLKSEKQASESRSVVLEKDLEQQRKALLSLEKTLTPRKPVAKNLTASKPQNMNPVTTPRRRNMKAQENDTQPDIPHARHDTSWSAVKEENKYLTTKVKRLEKQVLLRVVCA